MGNYRPICDTWFLARAKLLAGFKYYGAYLGGFPERARVLIGVPRNQPMLHACGGLARFYPYKGGFCEHDQTADIDRQTEPDYWLDLEERFPMLNDGLDHESKWPGILIDPPYSEADAQHYSHKKCPKLNLLMKNAMEVLEVYGKVGVIHYMLPKQPKNTKFIASIKCVCGFNNRVRTFSVFEKLA